MVLGLGTLAGLALLIVGFYLMYQWSNIITGGLEEWRKEGWRMGLVVLAVFGGLAVMFVALSMARGTEHTQPWLRRLLYGYNAVLTSVLLLAILVALNVLAYVPFAPFSYVNATYDWTTGTFYS